MLIRYCAIIFGCLALGELVVYVTTLPLSSSILGMLFLTFFLHKGWVKLQWVKAMSDLLVANLGLFFVPPSVAMMLYFDLILANFWSITIAVVVSTFVVILITGHTYQFFRKKMKP
ncbi:CidA/LrgA family protein [Capnocytophaga canimorsus]|uniref:CidA/LrgA family protein n=1 Tax=Capnocytophaga canimorsus TaxID=28188 RepID=UPI0037CFE9C1